MKNYLKSGNIYIARDYLNFTAVSLQPGYSEIRELSTLFDWDNGFNLKEWKPITKLEFVNAFNTALSKIIQHQTIELEKEGREAGDA